MRADNRDALLRGARACLEARGYARTTARDVASSAGVSLSAIGYHFGTVDALLIESLIDGMEEWSTGLDAAIEAVPGDDGPRVGSSIVWTGVMSSMEGYRGVLAASFELVARIDDTVEVHQRLVGAVDQARVRLAEQLYGIDVVAEPETAHQVGSVAYAVLSGLIVQWLVDPEAVPRPESIAAVLTGRSADLA